jgi:hypothetical protein
VDWQLSKVQPGSVQAFSFDERLIVRAVALLPTPAYRARIAVSTLLIYPPRYCVQVARDPHHAGPAPEVELPRLASGLFGLPPGHKTVEVHEARGSHRVPILPLRVAAEAAEKAQAQVPRYTATGYSTTFSVDEAFRDALEAMPRATSPDPAELTHVVIDHIGATFCAATGLRRLYVIVSRSEFAADPVSRTLR